MRMFKKKGAKIQALSLIINLVVAIIAFSFIISNVMARGAGGAAQPTTAQPTGRTWWAGNPIYGKGSVLPPGRYSSGALEVIGKRTGGKITLEEGQIAEIIRDGKKYKVVVKDSAGDVINEINGNTVTAASEVKGVAKPGSTLSKWLGAGGGSVADAILSGIQWAAIAYLAVQMIGKLLGVEEEKVDALSCAAAAAFGVGKLVAVGGQKGGILAKWFHGGKAFAPGVPWVAGIVAGLIVLELTYKEESKKIVTFECYPWEAPTGGENCEKCNSELYPCTEYRCKSLGQACQLLNQGTGEEKCTWVNPQDVKSPIIQPWKDVLSEDHVYKPDNAIRPPDRGVKIIYEKSSDRCIKAFTPLTFGITLNEPAQCKIDYNRTLKYEEMAYYFGGSNIYKYNHTQTLSLPSPDSINEEAPEIKADGTYNLYVRCQDANGNANDDLFVFSFCVEKGPDVTPPRIEGTSIANEMPFQYGLNETELEVYVNEPADCKWSRVDESYDNMEHNMSCSQHIWEMNNQMLYKCTTTLTDLEDYKDNIFYFRCKDQPWLKGTDKEADRNVNVESYKFVLKGTQPLNIVRVKPNGTITGYSTLATVNLEVETEAGYNYGDAWCSYTNITIENAKEDDWIQMYETGTNIHKQRLDLPEGEHTYYIQCVDLGGNAAYSNTTFRVEIDSEAPIVVRAYQDSGKLKIITDEKSICSYNTNEEKGCSFDIEEGTNMPYSNSTEHFAEWQEGKTYYVKCKDLNERQPLPTECSIIVRAES